MLCDHWERIKFMSGLTCLMVRSFVHIDINLALQLPSNLLQIHYGF